MPGTDKIWFITGCSTGFGRELSRLLLERGYKVAITARDPGSLAEFKPAAESGQALLLALDVTDPQQIRDAAASAERHFGRVDVLVNNAGIGYFAAVEESEDEEVRRMFEINVFGLANMTKALLPGMRSRRSGHIVNISSIGGLASFPAVGFYNATKFAVEGLSEALYKELQPLGVKVTIIEPSGFRTDWAGRSARESGIQIDDYAETAGANRANLRRISGNQAGDPVRAAEAIIKAVEDPDPPLRLLLGKAALKGARAKLELLARDFDRWEQTSVGADFPEA
ncbi:oxidoreductase [bacterium]|nr:oxidoreductase [bacterium]